MGSHVKYADQYPPSFRHFTDGGIMLDSYDDSLRYSDHVLGQAAGLILASREPACLLYVSDHGENLNDLGDGNYGHGTRALTKLELDVPFVFFLNDAFLAAHPAAAGRLAGRKDQPVSHDNICHTLMGIAGLRDPAVYRPELDLSSPDFKAGIRYITDENMNLYDFAAFDFSRKNPLQEINRTLAEKYRSKFTW
jgi:lipid A ethanolaminephosphotransferase